jgi:hypothetical protein
MAEWRDPAASFWRGERIGKFGLRVSVAWCLWDKSKPQQAFIAGENVIATQSRV